jgi:hypothetical protein
MSEKKKSSDLPLPEALAGNFQDAARWFSQLWTSSADAAGGMRSPGSAIPSMLLPTLDVKELEKRIADMRSVESWLELNLGLLRTTIQGLELQKQTLQTWQGFQEAASPKKSASGLGAGTAAKAASAAHSAALEADAANALPGFQPQVWWDALNQQFGHMAAQATQAAEQMAASAGAATKSSSAKSASKTKSA